MVPVCDKRYHIYNRFRHFGAEIKIVELSINIQSLVLLHLSIIYSCKSHLLNKSLLPDFPIGFTHTTLANFRN